MSAVIAHFPTIPPAEEFPHIDDPVKLPHPTSVMLPEKTPIATPDIAAFLSAVEKFRASAQPPLTDASLSSILFGAGKQIERLKQGCDITTGRLRAAWKRLRELEAGGPRTRNLPPAKGAADGQKHETEQRR